MLLVAWSPEPRSTVLVESCRCAGRREGLSPVTVSMKLAILCSNTSSAWMACGPVCHSGSTMTVSVKFPCLSAAMALLPAVSTIGMLALYDKPTRPSGLKWEPCRVIIAPRATLAGVTWSAGPVCDGGGGMKTLRPNATTTTPESPAMAATDSKNIQIQNVGKRRCDGSNGRLGGTYLNNGGGGSSDKVSTAPCPFPPGGREVTICCQFVRLCQASSTVSSSESSLSWV